MHDAWAGAAEADAVILLIDSRFGLDERAIGAALNSFLNGEPVLARAPGLWYRLRKRARKHKAVVTVASAVSSAGSTKNSPTAMKTMSGRSLPAVKRFTTKLLCLMPRIFSAVMAPMIAVVFVLSFIGIKFIISFHINSANITFHRREA